MFQKKFWIGFLLIISAATTLFAQGTTGRISGVVTDTNGAVVAGATVTATNLDTNSSQQTTSSDDGVFGFQLLPPGRYRVEVAVPGFQNYTAEVIVNITQTTNLDAQLGVAGATAVVTVETPVLQTETSQVGRVVEGETIRQLPLPTRNFQQLLTLQAGTSNSLSNSTELGRGDTTITVNGQRTTSNSVRINGVDANSIGTNSTPNIAVPATDTLQEFIVQTSNYDASNGRNAGGNVEAVTRGGSNDFRGNVYYFLRNKALNANDFFLNTAGRPKPVLTRNQYGGTLGGRIVRDRAFFFVSYQGTRERNGASLINSLTSPFIPPQLTDTNRNAAALGAAFNLTPAQIALISPIAVNLLNARLPSGQFAIPSAATASGFTPQSGLSRFRENQFNFNGDFNISDNHFLSAKFFIASNPTFQANYNFAGLGNGVSQLVGSGGDLDIKQKLFSITDTYIFNSNVSNQARFGYSPLRVTSVPEEPFTASQFGITNPIGANFPGLPTITVTGLFTLGSSPFADQSSRIDAYTYQDTLSIVAGNHRIRAGGEYRQSSINFFFNAFSRGQLIFPTFTNFLLGQSVSIIGSGVYDRSFRVKDFNAFVQDDWKITPRLTLNLGLRYDLFGLPVEEQGRIVNFLPDQFRAAAPPNGFVQPEGGQLVGVPTVEKTLVPVDKNNFAPRVGFAYQLDKAGKLVLRAGYGIYYDRFSTRYANTQLLNYPYLSLAVRVFGPLSTPFANVPQPNQYPVIPTIPASGQLAGVPISGIFVDPNLKTPYVQQYNVNVQWEFAKNTVLDVAYVGNKGTKLLQVLTLNQPIYNPTTNSFFAPFGTALSTQKNLAGGIQQVQTSSNSNYNSLQITGTRRFSDGLQILAAYTFGKSTDYYSGAAINELVTVPGDQRDWRTNRGRSDFDRKHRFVLSGVYAFPKSNFESRAARAILNNWEIAGIATFQTGLPFSIIDNPNNNIIQRANFNQAFSGEILTSGNTTERLNAYFNTAAFVRSCPILLVTGACGSNLGTVNNPAFDRNAPFGNTPRNFLTGPGQKNVDFSIIKFIPITERLRGEFRTEFFNVFNWANFANPNTNIAVPLTFGRITSASSGPRVIQFAFKLNF